MRPIRITLLAGAALGMLADSMPAIAQDTPAPAADTAASTAAPTTAAPARHHRIRHRDHRHHRKIVARVRTKPSAPAPDAVTAAPTQ